MGGKYPHPPERLKVKRWNEAYRIFYEKLNDGRSVITFERSMKNVRYAFDSHFPDSLRIGWRAENRKPNPLSKKAQVVFDSFKNKSEEDVWNLININADLEAPSYRQEFDDLIGIQESEVENRYGHTEGGKKIVTSSIYERSPALRKKAIQIHGTKCIVCGFDFKVFYGEWGKNYIEVHHIQSLATSKGKIIETNPKTDLVCICANCHRMLHRKKDYTLSIEELKKYVFDSEKQKG